MLPSLTPKKSKPSGPVRASHLLVKYNGSQNPVSRNPANDVRFHNLPLDELNSHDNVQPSVKITRSKSEAIEILRKYEDQIRQSNDLRAEFEDLATKHSDCASYRNKGDLDWFGNGVKAQMQKPFQDATYGLEVGEMSSVVETLSGMHLILRTG